MSKVLCPYCGDEMRHVATIWSDAEYYECGRCHSRSPSANAVKVKEAALTRESVPVVHGWWSDEYTERYVCTVCGSWFFIDSGDGNMNYYPNCGARMDGGASDG